MLLNKKRIYCKIKKSCEKNKATLNLLYKI